MSPKKNKFLKYLSRARSLSCRCGRSKPAAEVYQPLSKPNPPPKRTAIIISSSGSGDRLSFLRDDDKHEAEKEEDDDSTSAITIFSRNNVETSSNCCSGTDTGLTCSKTASPGYLWKKKVGESVAVVKVSENPYLDFRRSMLQMILEKEIYCKEALQELLARFLQLNSPCHHDSIIRAFTDIWKTVIFAPPSSEKMEFR
ncbi:hypothetical protein Dimus_020027 [Dionaea muscipula]